MERGNHWKELNHIENQSWASNKYGFGLEMWAKLAGAKSIWYPLGLVWCLPGCSVDHFVPLESEHIHEFIYYSPVILCQFNFSSSVMFHTYGTCRLFCKPKGNKSLCVSRVYCNISLPIISMINMCFLPFFSMFFFCFWVDFSAHSFWEFVSEIDAHVCFVLTHRKFPFLCEQISFLCCKISMKFSSNWNSLDLFDVRIEIQVVSLFSYFNLIHCHWDMAQNTDNRDLLLVP